MDDDLAELKFQIQLLQHKLYLKAFNGLLEKGTLVDQAKTIAIEYVETELGLQKGVFCPILNMADTDFFEGL